MLMPCQCRGSKPGGKAAAPAPAQAAAKKTPGRKRKHVPDPASEAEDPASEPEASEPESEGEAPGIAQL